MKCVQPEDYAFLRAQETSLSIRVWNFSACVLGVICALAVISDAIFQTLIDRLVS